MKKILVISIMVFVFSSSIAYAEESEKVSGLVVLKEDVVFSPHKDYSIPCISTFFHYKSIGGGFDLRYYERGRVTEFQPYLTFSPNKGKSPWYFLGGLSFDSNNTKYFQTGIWYINSFGKLNMLWDVRNWWAFEKGETYFDPFLQLLYPLPKPFNIDERFYAGVELEYNHFWSGPTHNWYFGGPLIGFKITKDISTFVRLSREWDVLKGDTTKTDRIRLGLNINF